MRKLHLLVLFASTLSSLRCATLPNVEFCSAASPISAGANCAFTLSEKTREMTYYEFLDFLEPNKERGGALCASAKDFEEYKNAMEKACRLLGPRCKKEVVQALAVMDRLQKNLKISRP